MLRSHEQFHHIRTTKQKVSGQIPVIPRSQLGCYVESGQLGLPPKMKVVAL